MSKATELALLKRSRSINASIGVSSRSGERENVGEMLDMYVHVQSAEDEYLENEENARKELFLKGFRLYVKKLYTEEERRFLSALMGKKVTLDRLFRNMKFGEFRELKRLQEKAQANVGILKKLSELSRWSGSEEFIGEFFARMERVRGREGAEEGTLNSIVERRMAHRNGWRRKHRLLSEVREREAAYYKREDVKAHRNERRREYRKQEYVRARETEYQRWYRQDEAKAQKHREEVREYTRRHAEENRARAKAWRIANRERYNAQRRESRRRKKEEQERLSHVVS